MPRQIWSKAYAIPPRDHIQSHKYIAAKPFRPSYEASEPDIACVLNNGYQRIWETELEWYLASRHQKETVKFIKPKMKKAAPPKAEPLRFRMKQFANIPARTDHKRPAKCREPATTRWLPQHCCCYHPPAE